MQNKNTFGVCFFLRKNKSEESGKLTVFARITVNQTRCEFSTKHSISKNDWNTGKGIAKPKNEELKAFNTHLEEIRGQFARHYRNLRADDNQPLTATAVKNAFLGIEKEKKTYTLLWIVNQHNTLMKQILKPGCMKNYYTTEKYIKLFLKHQYKITDILLDELNYEFITYFEFYVRNNAIKKNDPCTNNGTMKHMERLKKMVTWAVKNEWLTRNPFTNFKLRFKHKERDFLTELELAELETQTFENPVLDQVRDYFVFSCYTGLSYIDLVDLRPQHILPAIDNVRWIKTSRAKTEVAVNVPLLQQAEIILGKYYKPQDAEKKETVFPWLSNQEINRSLKIISEICGIKKHLTFHLARHTFATTVTLMNGVPIESISKMLGHTKISTTMIYAKVTQTKIKQDMVHLQNELTKKISKRSLKIAE